VIEVLLASGRAWKGIAARVVLGQLLLIDNVTTRTWPSPTIAVSNTKSAPRSITAPPTNHRISSADRVRSAPAKVISRNSEYAAAAVAARFGKAISH
jgi:hypothetical protein